ncbi:MAG: hypothetical protein R3E12_11855 [Candidatus Eisenbacteria bacterium]
MLRADILTTLVWHYLVDALYTSVLLFRSGNTYYVVSAAIASGIILIPLVYAIVSYLRNREFVDVEPLLNEREPAPQELPPREFEDLPPPQVAGWTVRRRLVTGLGALALLGTRRCRRRPVTMRRAA